METTTQSEALNLEVPENLNRLKAEVLQPSESTRQVRVQIRSYVQGTGVATFVAESRGRLVGVVQVEITKSPDGDLRKSGKPGMLHAVGVASLVERRKVSRELMECAEKWLRKNGLSYAFRNAWTFYEPKRFPNRPGFPIKRS